MQRRARRRSRRHRHALPDAARRSAGRWPRARTSCTTSRSRTRSRRSSRGGRTTRRTTSPCGRSSCRRATGPRCARGCSTTSSRRRRARTQSYWLDRKPDVFLDERLAAGRRRLVQLRHERLGRAGGRARGDARHRRGERALHPHGRRQPHPRLDRSSMLVEAPHEWKFLRRPPRTDEEDEIAAVICSLVGERDRAGRRHVPARHRHGVRGDVRRSSRAPARPRRAHGADLRRHPGAGRAGRDHGRAEDAASGQDRRRVVRAADRGRVRAGRRRPAVRAVLHEPHERHPGDRRARQHVRRSTTRCSST